MKQKIDKPQGHNITVRFSPEELVKLREIADIEGRPIANLVKYAVMTHLLRKT